MFLVGRVSHYFLEAFESCLYKHGMYNPRPIESLLSFFYFFLYYLLFGLECRFWIMNSGHEVGSTTNNMDASLMSYVDYVPVEVDCESLIQ